MSSPDPASRYDTSVDLGNENTSHTQLARLVGRDKRVLDVGCATGYLAAVLRTQGCSVSGIEYEPAAAERARPHLDRLVVGSVDELDLVEEFGAGAFDAVVYGDVLEHLTDPVGTLRRTVPLLAAGGAVVASLPHIAHGAVRLALLDGRFDYTETGLLDDTHVRFFTAALVRETFAAAGLAPVVLSRTTADLTATEIPLDLADYPEPVLRRVLADPESTTYQFVVRAVRQDEADPLELAALADAERERRRRHEQSRRSAATPQRTSEQVPAAASGEVGLWGAFDLDDLRQALLVRTTRTALEGRLPGIRLRSAAPRAVGRASRIDPGEALEPLDHGHGLTSAATALDAVVVTGLVLTDPHEAALAYAEPAGDDHPALLLGRAPSAGAAPVLWTSVDLSLADPDRARTWLAERGDDVTVLAGTAPDGPSPATLPDPGVLAPLTFPARTLERRLTLLRATGAWPRAGRAVLVHAGASALPHVDALAEALTALGRPGLDVTVVLAELHVGQGDASVVQELRSRLSLPTTVLPVDCGLDDLVAALSDADAVVSSSATALSVAQAFERTVLPLELSADGRLARWAERVTEPDQLAERVEALADALRDTAGGRADSTTVREQAVLSQHFDALAARVAQVVRERRASAGDPDVSVGLAQRVAALERAHTALLAVGDRDRAALAHVEPQVVLIPHPETEQLRAEVDALKNSKTMRALRPARAVYARLRGSAL